MFSEEYDMSNYVPPSVLSENEVELIEVSNDMYSSFMELFG